MMSAKKTKLSAGTPLPPELIGNKLLTDKQVQELTGLTRRQRRERERIKTFPQPIKLTQKLRLYPKREVDAWIAAREAAR